MPDPLWEKYYAWSPYAYCNSDPINYYDENGRDRRYIQEKGSREGERQKIYTTRTHGRYAGNAYQTGTTDNIWHNGEWLNESIYKQQVIKPIVNEIYEKGPSKVDLQSMGIDPDNLSDNFFVMVDEEVKDQMNKRKQHFFGDGTINPYYSDALIPNNDIFFGIGFKFTNNFLKNIIIKALLKNALRSGNPMYRYFHEYDKYEWKYDNK